MIRNIFRREGFTDVALSKMTFFPNDNGGRRSGIDRREFSYAGHIPERRCGQDRRSAKDRRNGDDRRHTSELRGVEDRRCGRERRVSLA